MYKILAINPGSTSTKIALFENDKKLFSTDVEHDSTILSSFKEIKDQFEFRKETIVEALEKNGISFEEIDAYSGRGGALNSLESGTYHINEIMLQHARQCLTAKHPAALGCQLADYFARKNNKPSFVVNPPDVDEFSDVARMTGLRGIYRESRIHALNQKEIGIRYADMNNLQYNNLNLIIAHIGGGISVTVHEKGKMIDSNDIINGDGPMAPTRCGSLPVTTVIDMCYSGDFSNKDMLQKATKTGGLVDHLGTADVRKILQMIDEGNQYAELVLSAMIYQIAKSIGACAAVLAGKVDCIIFTGGISKSDYIIKSIEKYVAFIAPVCVMAGEFEMEALAAGALRVLLGKEEPKDYSGNPIWEGI